MPGVMGWEAPKRHVHVGAYERDRIGKGVFLAGMKLKVSVEVVQD